MSKPSHAKRNWQYLEIVNSDRLSPEWHLWKIPVILILYTWLFMHVVVGAHVHGCIILVCWVYGDLNDSKSPCIILLIGVNKEQCHLIYCMCSYTHWMHLQHISESLHGMCNSLIWGQALCITIISGNLISSHDHNFISLRSNWARGIIAKICQLHVQRSHGPAPS